VYTPLATNRQVVITVSAKNYIYVMDALNGTILNSRYLGRPFAVSDLGGGCNDITPFVGVIGLSLPLRWLLVRLNNS